jgi:hypothetical protein
MRNLLIIFIVSLFTTSITAQELNCQVSVINSPQLQLSANDLEIIKDMETNIYEFMNTTRWTKDNFEIEERINCNILITLTGKDGTDRFSGKIQIQSSRPVLNSAYNTTLFNFVDSDFDVTYLRGSAILFSIEQYRDNLSSILGYYAYMILAYDYDSFSLEGGSEYFKKAQSVANLAKSSGDSGWESSAGKRKNRYWLVDNAQQSLFKPLRKAYYNYHRLGFDVMQKDMPNARKEVLASLKLIDKVQRARPGSINVQIFLSSKTDELVSLFSQAEVKEKNAAVNLLKRMDPASSSKYQEILK